MPTLDEAASFEGGAASLLAGLRTLSLDEEIVFWQHIRKVLPLDGCVFWLATQPLVVQGSLHVSAVKQQLEDETISVNRVVFTTANEIEQFNAVAPGELWIGEAHGLKFAFSSTGLFYKPSGLWHYFGDAVYPALESQLVPVGAELSDRDLIVSNSLPAWLAIVGYAPEWWTLNPAITLFPSFLVPANLPPPYGAVHIVPAETQWLGALPLLRRRSSHHRLASDRVRVTLYGATNEAALAFEDTVYQFSQDTNAIGIMEPAVVRDEKRTQAELGVLAMKKTLDFQVSYDQTAMRDIARQQIKQVFETFLPQPFVAPVPINIYTEGA